MTFVNAFPFILCALYLISLFGQRLYYEGRLRKERQANMVACRALETLFGGKHVGLCANKGKGPLCTEDTPISRLCPICFGRAVATLSPKGVYLLMEDEMKRIECQSSK